MRRGAAAGMARPAEKIAQLEAALEKKDQEIGVLKLTSRRLEEELNSFGKEAAEKMERLAEKDAYLERKLESLNGSFFPPNICFSR